MQPLLYSDTLHSFQPLFYLYKSLCSQYTRCHYLEAIKMVLHPCNKLVPQQSRQGHVICAEVDLFFSGQHLSWQLCAEGDCLHSIMPERVQIFSYTANQAT